MTDLLFSEQKIKYGYLILFSLFFISYGYFFQGAGWNQNARICLTRAIIHYGSFKIDYFKEDTKEMEFVNAGDWAYYKGHYYSNKSPGLSFMAVPPFAVAEYGLKFLVPNDPEQRVLFSVYFSTLCTVVLSSSLLCLLMFHLFHHFFQIGLGNSFLLTLFFGLGTLAFPYSTAFYCHQPAAFFSFLSFVLAMHIRHGSYQRKGVMAILAGLAAGSAVVFESSTIIMLVIVSLYLMSCKEGMRYISLFVLGCIPAALVQGLYNAACFGHLLASSYAYSNPLVMWKVNGRLFGIPSLTTLIQLLFSPYRGLFFSSPVLLMLIPGVLIIFRKREWRAEAILCCGIALSFILFIASFYAWHGGWAPGPRYLLPAFPYFFLLTGVSLIRFPKVFKLAGIFSICLNLSITVVGIEIPIEIKNPLSVILKSLIAGRVSINPFPFTHFNNYPSIYELANIEKWGGSMLNFNSFNLGEALFPHNLASILPLICFWILWGYWWKRFISLPCTGSSLKGN